MAGKARFVVVHVGLDLSRRRVDVCAISELGELLGRFRSPVENDDFAWPHRDGLIWPHFSSVVVGVDVA